MRLLDGVYPSLVLRLFNCHLLIAITHVLRPCFAAYASSQPFVATTSTDFFGYDGSWSAVTIRVGTPEQWLYVLPSTLSQETWVVGPAGCDGTTTCESKRGGLFFANESSTFQPIGFYDLNFDSQLGTAGYGNYGLDTLYLDDTTSVSDQIIAVVNSTDQWIGSLGLGVQETRFNGTSNYLPLLSSLAQNRILIPSHSYGYTAGASYRLKSVPASLIFGGVDTNRFTPNSFTFSLSSDYAPVVAITSIDVYSGGINIPDAWDSNPQTLLNSSEAALFTIDSSTPFLWLPETVCDAFQSALNLTYDDDLQLYVFPNDSTSSPEALAALNLTFSFTLAELPNSPEGITFKLPYDAFNLQLSYPFPNLDANFTSPAMNYFPLRRAANSSQYTIGRAFLQETYLTVDYERNNFSVSQAVFTSDAVGHVNLSAIVPPANSKWPVPESGGESGGQYGGLSTGAKAGIGVGVAGGVLTIAVLLWFFCFRRKNAKEAGSTEKPKRRGILARLNRSLGSKTSVSELLGDKRHPTEVPADSSVTRFELSGDTPAEMPAAPVSPSFFASTQTGSQGSRNSTRQPAELEHRDSTTKGDDLAVSERSRSPAPPYSAAADNNHPFSNGISPYSASNSHGLGTHSSGEQGISPVGAGSGGHSMGSSNSNNRSLPSPVSPDEMHRTRGPSLRDSQTNPSRTDSLLVPRLNGRPPSRSPSTGSRFREEGLGGSGEEQTATTPPGTGQQGARFSWEQ
ncbi:hypothetical protein ABEF95_015161 [Exophiala dermatitidis]